VDGDVVGVLAPGDGFGEVALLRGGRRSATVTSRSPVVLWSLDGPSFLACLQAGGGDAADSLAQVAEERLARARPVPTADADD
jgi:CRP-like cAMP-binding protein